jgi:hypothetical protein
VSHDVRFDGLTRVNGRLEAIGDREGGRPPPRRSHFRRSAPVRSGTWKPVRSPEP